MWLITITTLHSSLTLVAEAPAVWGEERRSHKRQGHNPSLLSFASHITLPATMLQRVSAIKPIRLANTISRCKTTSQLGRKSLQ
ncbi:hypothetical protein F5H01DRAFT_330890 [Linnemannia elongata]|nr:hypothetical protein F5H01DRAFT_330890 [Linnemannia elongata]